MVHAVQRFVALGMALGLIATDPVVQSLHHDLIPATSHAGASVAMHACGSHERHIPLNHIHVCGICLQRLQRSGQGATAEPLMDVVCCASGAPVPEHEKLACPSYLDREKRGPPVC